MKTEQQIRTLLFAYKVCNYTAYRKKDIGKCMYFTAAIKALKYTLGYQYKRLI